MAYGHSKFQQRLHNQRILEKHGLVQKEEKNPFFTKEARIQKAKAAVASTKRDPKGFYPPEVSLPDDSKPAAWQFICPYYPNERFFYILRG